MAMDLMREKAWIGDAVLALWARRCILDRNDIRPEQRTDLFVAMTSNRFLSTFGDPTCVESKIGEIYERDGLDAAFAWMDDNLLPVFNQQWNNRRKRHPGSKRSRR